MIRLFLFIDCGTACFVTVLHWYIYHIIARLWYYSWNIFITQSF